MEKLFHVNILTPEQKIFEGETVSLIVPAELGYLGVLANHAPLVANLVPGKIIYRDAHAAGTIINNNGKGILEVTANKATILLDAIG
ncbi:MAG: hypothetical protein Q7K98_02865 [Candidatus Omnitrophota bacterium]|nr:hypothetical protein [Candidatus Omnitrophota bacterium]